MIGHAAGLAALVERAIARVDDGDARLASEATTVFASTMIGRSASGASWPGRAGTATSVTGLPSRTQAPMPPSRSAVCAPSPAWSRVKTTRVAGEIQSWP